MANFVPAGLSAPVGAAAPVTTIPAGTVNAAGTGLTAGTAVTSNLLNAGIGSLSGDPTLIQSNNAIAQTNMLRPFNVNNGGRGSTYPGPVATPRHADITPGTANNAGYNQLMMELAQHFDPMIQISVMNQPRWWHDRIPRGAYTLFNGTTHETRIYRGGLMKYAGLSQWKDINPVPSTTNNPCAALPYETYKYGWEALSWSGKKAAWGSDPICLDMFKFFTQAMQQLSWILSTGAEYGIQMQEVWNRDMFIYQSVAFGRSYVMSSEYAYVHPEEVGDTAVILGGGLVGTELGIYLSMLGKKATVIEMMPEMNDGGNHGHQNAIQCEMERLGAKLDCNTKALEITDKGLRAENPNGEIFYEADTVIYAVGLKPRFEEANSFYDCAPDFHQIGDCLAVANMAEANRAAFTAARDIGRF